MMYNSDEEIEARTNGEWIANNLFPNDNVVVPTNTTNPFWLMLVDKGPHFVESNFEDAWGNTWQQGNVVIWGYWYDVLQSGNRTYFLQDDKPLAYVFSHIFLDSKLFLPPIVHIVRGTYATYELSNEAMNIIMVAIEHTQLLE